MVDSSSFFFILLLSFYLPLFLYFLIPLVDFFGHEKNKNKIAKFGQSRTRCKIVSLAGSLYTNLQVEVTLFLISVGHCSNHKETSEREGSQKKIVGYVQEVDSVPTSCPYFF